MAILEEEGTTGANVRTRGDILLNGDLHGIVVSANIASGGEGAEEA